MENAAHAVLLAVDRPAIAAGQKYFVADSAVYSMRQRVEVVAQCMGHRFEFVDMPFDIALPCHVLWRSSREHRLRDASKIERELGYKDVVGPQAGVERTIKWLVENRSGFAREAETVLGDPFDYGREDELIDAWLRARSTMPPPNYPLPAPAHMYRHPAVPNAPWQRPSR